MEWEIDQSLKSRMTSFNRFPISQRTQDGNRFGRRPFMPKSQSNPRPLAQRISVARTDQDWKTNVTCYNCDKKGHIARECPEPPKERNNYGRRNIRAMRTNSNFQEEMNEESELNEGLGISKMEITEQEYDLLYQDKDF
jgi:hypothetical protein